MENLVYVERSGSGSMKWDGLDIVFGEGSSGLMPLWVADADFKSPASVLKALEDWAKHGVYGYSFDPPQYAEAIVSWEKRKHGYTIDKSWLRYTPGVVTGMHWIVECFTKPGDGVLLLTPVYHPFYSIIKNVERTIVRSWLKNDNGKYTIDYADFEDNIVKNNVTMFIHCSPHNPVGRVWTREEQEKLAEICKKHGVLIVSDEIHQDLIMPGNKHVSMATIAEDTITVSSASKAFNIAGLSSAFAIMPTGDQRKRYDELANRIHLTKGILPSALATAAAYDGGEEWLSSFVKKIWENYEVLCDIIGKGAPKVVISPLEGTYLTWLDLSGYDCVTDLKEFSEKKCGIAGNYGHMFGGDDYAKHLRLNLATKTETIKTAAENIVKALNG